MATKSGIQFSDEQGDDLGVGVQVCTFDSREPKLFCKLYLPDRKTLHIRIYDVSNIPAQNRRGSRPPQIQEIMLRENRRAAQLQTKTKALRLCTCDML